MPAKPRQGAKRTRSANPVNSSPVATEPVAESAPAADELDAVVDDTPPCPHDLNRFESRELGMQGSCSLCGKVCELIDQDGSHVWVAVG